MEYQTRGESTGIQHFNSAREAWDFARQNHDVWKVSWFENGRSLRFRKVDPGNPVLEIPPTWAYEPMDDIIGEIYK